VAHSERQAAFVSAATNEVRTLLATFCLYSEPRPTGKVREETKRTHYLEALNGEARRLSHSGENVPANGLDGRPANHECAADRTVNLQVAQRSSSDATALQAGLFIAKSFPVCFPMGKQFRL
jgi:hypothetical protein